MKIFYHDIETFEWGHAETLVLETTYVAGSENSG
jgi:hypothetical protein